jgi:hypothetical protein
MAEIGPLDIKVLGKWTSELKGIVITTNISTCKKIKPVKAALVL